MYKNQFLIQYFFLLIVSENNKLKSVNFTMSETSEKTNLLYYEYLLDLIIIFIEIFTQIIFILMMVFKYIKSKKKNKFIISNLMEIKHDGII